MRVQFTPRAQRRAKLVAAWWRANRPGSPALFDWELEEATRKLAVHPDLGLVYATVRGEEMRRLLLPRTAQHVYYSIDQAAEIVILQTIWGARRGRAPKL